MRKKIGSNVLQNAAAPNQRACKGLKNFHMIIHVAVKLKEIDKLGRNYPWPTPARCPCCSNFKVWGHGFVDAWFDGFPDAIILKRWRCPLCNCIMRCRPKGYFNRFQAAIKIIRFFIFHRLNHDRWPPGFGCARPGHWLRSLKKRVAAYLGDLWRHRLPEAFDFLISQGHIPVSRSI